jgi:putative peptidoglycan lipid II flippase
MEFPTALLGVRVGVVLLPQLSAARRRATRGAMRPARLGSAPGAAAGAAVRVALLVFPEPLVAVLYHRGAFRGARRAADGVALRGYGVGLIGLVALKS